MPSSSRVKIGYVSVKLWNSISNCETICRERHLCITADPQALLICVAAQQAVHFIGMPEGALAQAVRTTSMRMASMPSAPDPEDQRGWLLLYPKAVMI
jgi:hypothetical protein